MGLKKLPLTETAQEVDIYVIGKRKLYLVAEDQMDGVVSAGALTADAVAVTPPIEGTDRVFGSKIRHIHHPLKRNCRGTVWISLTAEWRTTETKPG